MQIGSLDFLLTNPGKIDKFRDTFSPILARLYVRTCNGEETTDKDLGHQTFNQLVRQLLDDIEEHIDDDESPESFSMFYLLMMFDDLFIPLTYPSATRINTGPTVLTALLLGFSDYVKFTYDTEFINHSLVPTSNPELDSPIVVRDYLWCFFKERYTILATNQSRGRAHHNPYSRISPTHQTGLSDTDLSDTDLS